MHYAQCAHPLLASSEDKTSRYAQLVDLLHCRELDGGLHGRLHGRQQRGRLHGRYERGSRLLLLVSSLEVAAIGPTHVSRRYMNVLAHLLAVLGR